MVEKTNYLFHRSFSPFLFSKHEFGSPLLLLHIEIFLGLCIPFFMLIKRCIQIQKIRKNLFSTNFTCILIQIVVGIFQGNLHLFFSFQIWIGKIAVPTVSNAFVSWCKSSLITTSSFCWSICTIIYRAENHLVSTSENEWYSCLWIKASIDWCTLVKPSYWWRVVKLFAFERGQILMYKIFNFSIMKKMRIIFSLRFSISLISAMKLFLT